MFGRAAELIEVKGLLRASPVVVILGPRQIGKTTLAREIAGTWHGPTSVFDLEDPRDLARLADPTTALAPLRGLNDEESTRWRRDLIRTYVEQDLPQLGVAINAGTVRSFWTMLAHYHAQIWNGAELARAFAIAESTVKRYLDVLVNTFMVRALPPWSENMGKRVVRTPKIYIADTGLLHALLDIPNAPALDAHPKVGASFEGFALQELVRARGARPDQCYFWATHQGAELDLLVVQGRRRRGFEFKRTDAPAVTKSMHIAIHDLGLESLDVVHLGRETYPLGPNIRAVAIARLTTDLVRPRGATRR